MTYEYSISPFQPKFSLKNIKDGFIFWSKNFGFVFLMWLFALILVIFKKIELNFPFVLSSLFLFLIPNLFLFQPWDFDNGKIFFYWWVISIIFCCLPLLRFFFEREFYLGKFLIILILFFSTLAGILDFSQKLILGKRIHNLGYSDEQKENILVAEWIRKNTEKNSLFLTTITIDPTPIFLAGRPIYVGFTDWFVSQSVDYLDNIKKAQEILSGNLKLACKEKIDYILVDQGLKDDYPMIDEKILESEALLVFYQPKISFEEKKIYKVICGD